MGFKEVSTGGNMLALELYLDGYQILVSDMFGNTPRVGEDWSMSLYKKIDDDYDETPFLNYEGEDFFYDKLEEKMKEVVFNAQCK